LAARSVFSAAGSCVVKDIREFRRWRLGESPSGIGFAGMPRNPEQRAFVSAKQTSRWRTAIGRGVISSGSHSSSYVFPPKFRSNRHHRFSRHAPQGMRSMKAFN
jgi:hypothetical protein